MRRAILALLAPIAVAALSVAGSVSASPQGAAARGTSDVGLRFYCGGSRTLRYVYWPKGHHGAGAPSVFPDGSFAAPAPDQSLTHLNVYRNGGGFGDSRWLLTLGPDPSHERPARFAGRGYTNESRLCSGPGPGSFADRIAAAHRSSRSATALRCRYGSRYGYVGVTIGPVSTRRVVVYQLNKRKHPLLLEARLNPRPQISGARRSAARSHCPTDEQRHHQPYRVALKAGRSRSAWPEHEHGVATDSTAHGGDRERARGSRAEGGTKVASALKSDPTVPALSQPDGARPTC